MLIILINMLIILSQFYNKGPVLEF